MLLGTRDGLFREPSACEWQAIISLLLTGLERLLAEQLPPLNLKLQWLGVTQMTEEKYKLHCNNTQLSLQSTT